MRYFMLVCTQAGAGLSKLYLMQLESGLFLDAKRRGSIARFINHRCAASRRRLPRACCH
jgi:hypothetical protein